MAKEELKHLIIEDTVTGKIRLTPKAVERFGKRFARAGIDIRTIKTKEDLRRASDLWFEMEMRAFAQSDAGKDPLLKELFTGMPGWDDLE